MIILVYLHIICRIHQTDRYLGVEHQSKVRNRKNLIRMLATVVIIFFICWIPFHAQRVISIFFPNVEPTDDLLTIINNFLFYVSGYFYYSNSALNPIVYSIMSTKYRHAFIRTILCWKCSDNFYTKVNISTYSKNRQSLSRQSRPRSFSRTEDLSKRLSVDSRMVNKRSISNV